jgi:hypothetical protein
MKIRSVGFQQAVSILEPYAAGNVPRVNKDPEIRIMLVPPKENEAKTFTYEKHYQPSEWLQKRNLGPDALQRFAVGLHDDPARKSAYKGKIMIRIQRFSDGATVGYLARDPRPPEERGDSPKYVFPEGVHKSLELFGAWQLKQDGKLPLRILYLVESPFTVLKFWQMGLPAVSRSDGRCRSSKSRFSRSWQKEWYGCPTGTRRRRSRLTRMRCQRGCGSGVQRCRKASRILSCPCLPTASSYRKQALP